MGDHVGQPGSYASGGRFELALFRGIERLEENVLLSRIWKCLFSTCKSTTVNIFHKCAQKWAARITGHFRKAAHRNRKTKINRKTNSKEVEMI